MKIDSPKINNLTTNGFVKTKNSDGSLEVDTTTYGTGTVTSVAALTLGTTGTDLSSTVATGTTTPVITLQVPDASSTNRGALTSANFNIFNAKAEKLTCVSKTADYTASPNEIVNCDVSAGSFKVTLPSAPADKTVIFVKLNAIGTNKYLTIATGGTDKFNTPTGTVEIYMYLFGEFAQMQYCSATGIWTTFISAATYNWANQNPGVDASTPITNADISIDTSTRVLTVTPPLGYFNIFSDGNGIITRFRKVGTINFPAFTNTSGMWFFYFDSTGTAVTTQIPWTVAQFPTIIPMYRLHWNATLYNFTITAGNVSEGATYTNNGQTFTIRQTYTGVTTIKTSGTGDPSASGTLTRATGTGDATLTFSAFSVAPRLVEQYVEYHVNDIPADTHMWFHLQGAQWMSGLTIANNALVTGTPNADGRNTVIALSSGSVTDDNLEYTVTNDATPTDPWQQDLGDITPATLNATNSALMTTFRQNGGGAVTLRDTTRFPFDWGTTTNIPNYITATGVRTPVADKEFFVYFVYATQNPAVGEAIKLVSATSSFATITNARAFNWVDIQNTYTTLNDGEVRPLYRLILEYRASYSAGAKYSVIRETQDLRKAAVTSTTAATGSLPASSVTFVPYDGIGSTNVQSALSEVADERVPLTRVAVSTAVMAEQATGFTLAGGTTSKTLTVALDANVSGTNTGDNAANSSSTYIGTTAVALNRASAALTLAGITLTTPDIGTPSAGILTNCTGLPSAFSTAKTITQVGHGFAVNDVIKFAGTTYQKAQADSAANAEVAGVVTAINGNDFTFTMEGFATLGTLTSDTIYFLSAATPGLLTATEPSTVGQISKPVLKTTSTTTGIINNMRGIVIASAGDVVGPASSTDNAIARYDGTTGKLVQDSLLTVSDLLTDRVNITSPAKSGTGMRVGLYGGDSTDGAGGVVVVVAGSATSGNNAGGTNVVQGGTGYGSGSGGQMLVNGGPAGATGTGGNVNVQGGAGGATSGDGGPARIYGGNATAGNSNGGIVLIKGGTKSGSGTDGKIYLQAASPTASAILNLDSVATSDKTFTFPNETGTFLIKDTDNITTLTPANFDNGNGKSFFISGLSGTSGRTLSMCRGSDGSTLFGTNCYAIGTNNVFNRGDVNIAASTNVFNYLGQLIVRKVAAGANPITWASDNTFDFPTTNGTFALEQGAWTSYTVTPTNLTKGAGGTLTGYYQKIGKTVICRIYFQFGSGSAVSGDVTFSLPVTSISYPAGEAQLGVTMFTDAGTDNYYGMANWVSTTAVRPVASYVGGTFITSSRLSSTVPYTWTTNDNMTLQFIYEAA